MPPGGSGPSASMGGAVRSQKELNPRRHFLAGAAKIPSPWTALVGFRVTVVPRIGSPGEEFLGN
jgi:hypothetical protein